MPKVSHRCNRRTQQGVPTVASASFLTAPRKVSFEDNFPDVPDRATASPLQNTILESRSEEVKPLRKKSSLARPKSSLSLVELALSVESEDNMDTAAVTISAPVSPLSSPRVTTPPLELTPTSFELPGSPWGQFVDMASPEEEARTSVPQHSYGAPCSCCSTCRRRRSNPYGDYRRCKQRAASSNDSLGLFGLSKWTTSRTFRLTPRKAREPTEQLIGALDRLQVD